VVFRHFYTVASCTCRLEYAAAGTAGESQLSSDAMRSLCVLDRRCRDDKIDRWTDELADDCVAMGVKKNLGISCRTGAKKYSFDRCVQKKTDCKFAKNRSGKLLKF
jgi:hypothetical protein